MTSQVRFVSLTPGDDAREIRSAIDRVIERGWFVLGPEVEAFEGEFAVASHAPYAVGVGSGTDAISLTLRALGIGPGDEVITTSLSAVFTALAIAMVGARPVFADIDPVRLTMDPEQIAQLIGPRTRAIVPVHLYGQPADMTGIERVAARHGLAVVEDCCQAHLATADGRPVGTIGVAGAFSFYPTKNLGAFGDGGAIVTRDAALADRIRRLRNGGQPDRYDHDEFGVNSRLDEMQAAILRARLPRLKAWTSRRRSSPHGTAPASEARRSRFRRSATPDTCIICSSSAFPIATRFRGNSPRPASRRSFITQCRFHASTRSQPRRLPTVRSPRACAERCCRCRFIPSSATTTLRA